MADAPEASAPHYSVGDRVMWGHLRSGMVIGQDEREPPRVVVACSDPISIHHVLPHKLTVTDRVQYARPGTVLVPITPENVETIEWLLELLIRLSPAVAIGKGDTDALRSFVAIAKDAMKSQVRTD